MAVSNWNEPAEWLRSYLGQIPLSTKPDVTWLDLLDQALAEERRATVERIRTALDALGTSEDRPSDYLWALGDADAILDAEADR